MPTWGQSLIDYGKVINRLEVIPNLPQGKLQ